MTAPSHRASRRSPAAWSSGRTLASACALSVMVVAASWTHPADAPGSDVVSLIRVAMASLLSATLLLGPGLVLRGRDGQRLLPLGFVPIPGILLLSLTGLVVWLTAPDLDPQLLSAAAVTGILAVVAVLAWRGGGTVAADEARVLGVAVAVYVVVLGKALWSLGPAGELYAGTISRTLEVGDRPDSRISYHVTSLVASGISPYSEQGASLFAPYSFYDRGPVPGFLTAPVMLASGTTPTPGLPEQPWSLFDPQGFLVYRLVMMMLALTALLAVYTLARAVAGPQVARVSVLVVAGTPFFVHDVYFTWPKFAASGMCLLAAYLVIKRRPLLVGLFVGLGFLMHPLALLTVPTLVLLTVLVESRLATIRRLHAVVVRRGVGMALGLLGVIACWRLLNAGQQSPAGFLNYLRAANGVYPTTPADWMDSRYRSVASTLVPLRVPLSESTNPSVNAVSMPSDGVIHFFFQYWVGLPFGVAMVFFPVLLVGLFALLRRHPWSVVCLGIVPFVIFAAYWGSSVSGLMREGLHPWLLGLVVLWSWHLRPRLDEGRAPPTWLRVVLALRPAEVAVMLTVPSIHGSGRLLGVDNGVGDVVAVAMMTIGLGVLAGLTIRGTAADQDRSPTNTDALARSGVRRPDAPTMPVR